MGYKFIHRFNCFVGDSSESKPLSADIGSVLEELDTGKEYIWDSTQWVERIGPGSRTKLWNTVSLAWEAATKGTGVGEAVEVQNFPATQPISDLYDDITSQYKITDIDTSGATMYFGFTDSVGNWFIMQFTGTAARYIKGASGYTTNWTGRAGLSYDYFYNTF